MSERIELGDLVRDTISQYEGICLAKVTYLTGCDQVGIKPQGMKKDGGTHETLYFDEPFVEVVRKSAIKPVVLRAADAGGPGLVITQG